MTLGALSPGALLSTAFAASLFALFFDWRGRLVRRLGAGHDRTPRAARGAHEEITMAATAPTHHHDVDDVLEASFPASDPPAWTPGMARLTPPSDRRRAAGRRPGGSASPHATVARATGAPSTSTDIGGWHVRHA